MMRKQFNFIASSVSFLLGTAFVFSDSASITANVIGASGSDAAYTSIIGIFMIIGAIALFVASMVRADDHQLDLERFMRRTKNHEHIDGTHHADPEDEDN